MIRGHQRSRILYRYPDLPISAALQCKHMIRLRHFLIGPRPHRGIGYGAQANVFGIGQRRRALGGPIGLTH